MISTGLAAAALAVAGRAAWAQDAPGPAAPEHCPFQAGDVVMIVGDSIGGPAQIIQDIPRGLPDRKIRFLQVSLGGNTVRDAVGRMRRDVIRGDLAPDRDVTWYVVMYGANDSGIPELIEGGYETYYRRLIAEMKRRTRARVVLVCSPAFSLDSTWHAGRTKVLGRMADTVKRLGREYGLEVVDLYAASLDFVKARGGAAFARDGIHPTPEAHRFMSQTFLKQFNFYGLAEQVEADLAPPAAKGTDGCRAEMMPHGGGGVMLRLTNLYDFPREVGVTLKGLAAGSTVFDEDGRRVVVKDGACVVRLPKSADALTEDLKPLREAAAKYPALAGPLRQIDAEIDRGRTLTLRILPAGAALPPAPPGPPPAVFAPGVALLKAAQALPANGEAAALKAAAERFVQQFCDLRLNFPATTLRAGQVSALAWGVARAGDAARKPVEKMEAFFTNFDAPSVSGSIRVSRLPGKGWQATPAGAVEFKGLRRGERFAASFEVAGDETTSLDGEMVVTAEYELDGVKLRKDETFRLFSPWLAAGTFCDKAEDEKAELNAKIQTAYPPEKSVDVAAVYPRYDGKDVRWKAFRSFLGMPLIGRAGQVLWDAKVSGAGDGVVAPWQPPGVMYVAGWVHSPKAQAVLLHPEFASRVSRLWVNGKLALSLDDPGDGGEQKCGMNWTTWNKTDFSGGQDRVVEAALKEGWNELLFKFVSATRAWNGPDVFSLRIWDAERRPVPGLLGSCAPPDGPRESVPRAAP